MKRNVYAIDGSVSSEVDLPQEFQSEIRVDLIRRAFRAITLSKRHPYGSSPRAGMRRVGQNLGPGHGMSRIPRVSGGSRGVILASMVGGKSAHSPRSNKVLFVKINDRERKKARLSALASIATRDMVAERGYRVPEDLEFPIIVDDSVSEINKTKEAVELLDKLGLADELEHIKDSRNMRAGRGKMRGRKYRQPRGLLLVESRDQELNAFRSIPGVEISKAQALSIEKLAPGGVPGRLTIFTKSALESMNGVKSSD